MGFFKKPVAPIDNDEQIRREIRARVAKQAGIYDEEYINTGKISGTKKVETLDDTALVPPVIVAAIPVITENEKGETELSFEPVKKEPISTKAATEQVEPVVPTKSAKELKPAKEPQLSKAPKPAKEPKPQKTPKPAKEPKAPKPAKEPKPQKTPNPAKPSKEAKPPKKKKRNLALILFIVVLILAFIPLYYFLTGGYIQGPQLKISNPESTVLLSEPMLVRGMVSDSDNSDGAKVYYSLDNGSASVLYTFEAGPGPFDSSIELPDTADFLGEHSVTLYVQNPKGELSEATILNFKVVKPGLTGLEIKTSPNKTYYVVGEPLDLAGLVISASYEDEKTEVTSGYTSDIPTGTKLTKSGSIMITISYTEGTITKVATFSVSVEKEAVGMPSKKHNGFYPILALEV